MPPEPVPAEPEWDDDPAWSRPDPMTAAELKAGQDRVCEQDEGHLQDEDEDGDFMPFTPGELAEIRALAGEAIAGLHEIAGKLAELSALLDGGAADGEASGDKP